MVKPLTRHHLLPRRFYGSDPSSPILHICRKCHDEIEEIIPQYQKLPDEEYFAIAREFLKGEVYEMRQMQMLGL
jgi:hypothetical protein